MMTRIISAPILCSALLAAGETKFYFVDVGHGDAGLTRAADRILAFMDQNGIGKIDYLVISHFEDDHMGAARRMAPKTRIVKPVV